MGPKFFRSRLTLLALMLVAMVTSVAAAHADVLAVPGSVTGTLTSAKKTYSVTVPSDGDVTFTVTNSAGLYSLLRFYDSDGTSQLSYQFIGYGGTNTLTIPHLAPGATYFVSVEIYGGSGSFTLSDTLAQPAVAIDLEKNDTPATASAPLVSGTPVTGHLGYSRTSYSTQDTIDYYKVKVAADGDLTFTLTTNSTLYALIRFWDSNGTSQLSYQFIGYGGTNTLTIPHLSSAATYFVSVEVYGGYGGYTLNNTLVKPTGSKDTENNDTYKTAIVHNVGITSNGHLGYSRTAYTTQDTIDYYKVKVAGDGDLKFTLTTNATLYALLRFWDTNGKSQLSYQYIGYGGTNTLTIPHLSSAATYFVSVEVYGGYGTYKLSSALTKPVQKKDLENNDTYLTAVAFPLNSTLTGHLGYSRSAYNTVDGVDYYKVAVASAGNLTVNLTTSGTLYGLVRIWSTSGTSQINYMYVGYGGTNSFTTALPGAGTYYVSVEVYGGYGGYTLKNTF